MEQFYWCLHSLVHAGKIWIAAQGCIDIVAIPTNAHDSITALTSSEHRLGLPVQQGFCTLQTELDRVIPNVSRNLVNDSDSSEAKTTLSAMSALQRS